MALNENLQNAVNDLKTAKESIAESLSTGNLGINSSDGFETIANQLTGKKVNDTSGVTATENDVLSGKSIVDANGTTITGNIAIKSSQDMTGSVVNNTFKMTGPSGYYANGINTQLDVVSPGAPMLYYNSTNNTIAAQSFGPSSPGYIAANVLGTSVTSRTPASLEPNGNLKAENIKWGTSIFGVSGSVVPILLESNMITFSSSSNSIQLQLNNQYERINGFFISMVVTQPFQSGQFMNTGLVTDVNYTTVTGNVVSTVMLYDSYGNLTAQTTASGNSSSSLIGKATFNYSNSVLTITAGTGAYFWYGVTYHFTVYGM